MAEKLLKRTLNIIIIIKLGLGLEISYSHFHHCFDYVVVSSRRNVGWASTCNSVGQTAGYFMGHVVFLALESADLCNLYIRSEPKDVGIITLSGTYLDYLSYKVNFTGVNCKLGASR